MNLNEVVIHTTRLRLIPIRKEHITEVFENFTTDITKHMYPQPTGDIKDTEAFVISSIEGLNNGTNLQLVILDTEDGDFLGCAGLHHVEQLDPELGIWIKKKSHGRGLGLEAMNGLIRWAKENLKFDHLKYPVARNNHASKRIPIMNGGKLMKEYISVNQNGESMDIVEYWIYV